MEGAREELLKTGIEIREAVRRHAGTVATLAISPESAQSQNGTSRGIGEIITKGKPRDRESMMMLREDPSEEWLQDHIGTIQRLTLGDRSLFTMTLLARFILAAGIFKT